MNMRMNRIIPIAASALLLIGGLIATGTEASAQTNKPATGETMDSDTVKTMSGLSYIVQEKGDESQPVKSGMEVQVDYAGYLLDGTLFDTSIETVAAANSYDRGGYPYEPLKITVGVGQVIQGWDEGLTTDMYVGGRRRIIIPANLGYGSSGAGGVIPPNATLVFDVHVISAK